MSGETEELEQEELDSDFSSGFDDEPATRTEKPEAREQTESHEPKTAVRYAQITEDELNELRAKSTTIDEIKAENKRQFDKAFGTIGGMQQLLQQLQASTQAGKAIEISEDDFDDLKKEYPDLAALHVKGLNKALGKIRGVGQFDPTALEHMVGQRVAAALQTQAEQAAAAQRGEQAKMFAAVKAIHPDYEQVTGDHVKDAGNEFRKWLAAQPEEYQERVTETWNPKVVAACVTKFKESRKASTGKPAAASARKERFDGAVNPRGTGGNPPAREDADDDFSVGFRTG